MLKQAAHNPKNCIALLSVTQGHGYGAESVLIQLLNNWPASAQPLLVAAPPGSSIYACARKPNISYLALDTTGDTILSNLNAANRLLPQLRHCRIIHGWSARTFEIAWWLGRRMKAPAVCTLHDHPASNFITPSRQRVMRWMANRLDCLVCVSDAVRKACAAAGYRVPLRVVHNGLLNEGEPLHRQNPTGSMRIGFLGMNAPLKGYRLIETWIRQTKGQPLEWHLYGVAHESYRQEAARLPTLYPGQVFLHGRQAPDLIYPQIDLLISPSTEFDSFPTVLLEAARAGLPAVASDRGGSLEIVAHQETGFLFSPSQPQTGLGWINLLAQSPELRRSVGQAARRRFVSEFGVEHMLAHYAALWEELAAENLS